MQIKRVHFIGIGGSGVSAVAQLAHAQGFKVSGCDLNTNTSYISKVASLGGIKIFPGHDIAHLKQADIVAVSPAVFFQSSNHPEIVEAILQKKLIKWQEFLGKYLHKNKFVICIAGTHGKSTTTAMVGHLLENAHLDPTVELGATDLSWQNNIRIGHGKYFISEADEFHDNFSNFRPDILILNNIELDHPEYFHTLENTISTFAKFLSNIKPNGVLIYNSQSLSVKKLIEKIPKPHFSLIPFSPEEFPREFSLGIPGKHNLANAQGVITLSKCLKIPDKILYSTLANFKGLSRRIELIGEKNGIKIYDDYANHPTAIAASIETVKNLYPAKRLLVVIEPHTVSRLRATLDLLPPAVQKADRVIISEIFTSRETADPAFTGRHIAKSIPNAKFIAQFDDIVNYLKLNITDIDIILVMGSGNSHILAKNILKGI